MQADIDSYSKGYLITSKRLCNLSHTVKKNS
jgi:hypothetical protein